MGKMKFATGEYTYTMEKLDPFDSWLPANHQIIGPEPDHDFILSIAENGIWYPIIVTLYNRRYELIDGGRRLKVARLLEFDEIVCQVYDDVNPQDQKAIAIILNDQRSRNIVLEYQYLSELRNDDYQAFLDRTRLQPGHVNKVMKLDNTKDAYRDAWLQSHIDGKIALGPLLGAAKLTKPRQDHLWEIFETTGKFTGPDVRAAKEASTEAVLAAASFLSEEVQVPEVFVPENLFAVLDPSRLDETEVHFYTDWHDAFEDARSRSWKMYKLVEV
jgi:hypothetical protein